MSTSVASGARGLGLGGATSVAMAKRGLAVYFAVLVPGSGLVEWIIIRWGEQIGRQVPLIFILMWMPALSSLVARAVCHEGIGDVSFRLGGRETWRGILTAYAMPLIVGGVAYGAAWGLGLTDFKTAPHGGFFPSMALALTAGTGVGMLSAGGEEIGWRGYMLTRLVDAGVPRPILVSGLIWAAWHLPLILSGVYAAGPNVYVSALVFIVDVIGIALVIGVIRLRSGVIWPSIVLHAAWNAIIQGPFDQSATGPRATVWVGESGYLVAAMSLVVGVTVLAYHQRHPVPAPSA